MSSRDVALAAVAALWAGLVPCRAGTPLPEIGRPLTSADLAGMIAIPPSGAGLPAGRGTAAEGAKVFANQCAACHGQELEGIKATGAPPLVGGRGTLSSAKPVKTVESYWPYATTLFDYVKRAMPFNAPGSLSDDEVYAVTAYILAQGRVIPSDETMDAASLPKVRMPNVRGFVPDPRPGTPKVVSDR